MHKSIAQQIQNVVLRNMRNSKVVSLGGALLYFIIWMNLAFPYRPFPNDDLLLYECISKKENIINLMANSHNPVFLCSLLFFKIVWSRFSDDLLSTLLFSVAISNTLIVFLIGIIVFRLTRNLIAATIGMALYATSAWPANYLFFNSYTPFSTMLSLLSFFFIIEAYKKREKRAFNIFSSGIIAGLNFWTSSSASLVIVSQLVMLIYLTISSCKEETKKSLFIYSLSLYCAIAPFIFSSGLNLFWHLFWNIHTGHYDAALAEYNYIPRSPPFSFFYIGRIYSPLLFVSFAILSLTFVLSKLTSKTLQQRKVIWATTNEKVLFALVVIAWIHLITIDILPFTKLGRTHFVIYPIVLIITVTLFYLLISNISNRFPRYRAYIYISWFIIFAFVIIKNVRLCQKLSYVRTYTPKYLKSLPPNLHLYILTEDVHSYYIKMWLSDLPIKEARTSDFKQIIASDNPKGKVGLLIGPTGIGSGASMLHPALPDFLLEKLDIYNSLKNIPKIVLPYYAYFPTFLCEEEISQALFFTGKTPSYKMDSKNITLLLW